MSASTLPFQPPRAVRRSVSRLRLAVRAYVLVEGLAAALIALGASFWLALAIDWKLEPSPPWRIVMWLIVAAAAAFVAWRFLVRRALAPLRSDSLALLVERQHPHLAEGLVTAIQAAGEVDHGPLQRTMLDETARRVEQALGTVKLARVFDYRPLARKSALAAALIASVGAFAALAPNAFGVWMARMRLSTAPWPRQVQLTVVGFEDRDGARVVNVARDDAYTLSVLASIVDGHVAPREVEVRWRLPDGRRGRGPMLRIGEAVAPRDQAQRFQYAFTVANDVEFDVIGGDDRVRNLRLHAVERPAIVAMEVDCTYPAYLARPMRTLPVSSGRIALPEGATAACRVVASKPLVEVRVHDPAEQTDRPAQVSADDPTTFFFDLGRMVEDRVLLITLSDRDGVQNRDPYRVTVTSVRDQPPEVDVRLRGIGTAVTPQARIPWVGRLVDDYGLTEAWFEYEVDGQGVQRRELRTQPRDVLSLRMSEPLDLAETDPATSRPRLELSPGQSLVLAVLARDAYDLDDTAHVGSSARFHLEVVTPSELRALLERRELGLRQRFQAVYEKMVGVRDLIDRIDLADPAAAADDTDAEDVSEGRRASNLARLGSSRQSALQIAAETTGVADGFDDILAEMVNNRVDTQELTERLEQGISEPLKEIGGVLLPRFEERLAAVQTLLAANSTETAQSLADARALAQGVVDAMQSVLDRMLELESYNELVDLLRGIVQEQEDLREETLRRQRERLRELLEE